MSGNHERERTVSSILVLLAILIALPILVSVFMFRGGKSGEDRSIPRTEQFVAYLLVNGEKYLFRDKDRDGRVDCLAPTGASMFSGRGVWRAEDADTKDIRCSNSFKDAPVMEAGLQDALSSLQVEKVKLDAGHLSCIDLDGDMRVDCIVSVHDPDRVVLAVPGANCASAADAELTDDQRAAYSKVLALEEAVRAYALGGAD